MSDSIDYIVDLLVLVRADISLGKELSPARPSGARGFLFFFKSKYFIPWFWPDPSGRSGTLATVYRKSLQPRQLVDIGCSRDKASSNDTYVKESVCLAPRETGGTERRAAGLRGLRGTDKFERLERLELLEKLSE